MRKVTGFHSKCSTFVMIAGVIAFWIAGSAHVAAEEAGMSGDGASQTKSIHGTISGWSGGEGVLVNDSSEAVGKISSDGSFEWKPTGTPTSGLYKLEESYTCDGVTLTNGSAKYRVLGGEIGVTDTSGSRTGRILGASSEAVVEWSRHRRDVAAVPGYRVRLIYVDGDASAVGECASNVQQIVRKQRYKKGWNLERDVILAVGDSEFFPVDAPTEVLWETIDSVPADIIWVYEGFRK